MNSWYIYIFLLIFQWELVYSFLLKSWLSDYFSESSWNFLTGNIFKRLGDQCERSIDCIHVNNSICTNKKCLCQNDFYETDSEEDSENGRVCRLAPNYKEPCRKNATVLCRFPFVCTPKGICDCPPGFLSNRTHCIRDCKPGYIIVGSLELSGGGKCLPISELGESCSFNEQCTLRYSRCIHNKCECILGTLRRNKHCITIKQCPIGEAPLENGHPLICDRYTLKCPEGNYCLYAQFTDQRGFCCPVLKMNCPVDTPLAYDCANCPWDTHHCFTYTIGGLHKQHMCCPNDCPRSQPIRYQERCYSLVGHNAHCLVDHQCISIQNAICTYGPINEEKICQCPLDYTLIGGKCIKKSKLGGECITNDDCLPDSNTICLEGICQCSIGFIPEPIPNVLNESSNFLVEHCIAEPACPSTKGGLEKLGHDYEDCSSDGYKCPDGKYCRRWYVDAAKQRQYSTCCPIPKKNDYEEICNKLGMTLLLENGLKSDTSQPINCQLSIPVKVEGFYERLPETACPSDSTCIHNPHTNNYSINEGICCKHPPLVVKPSAYIENNLYKFLGLKFYP